MKKILLVFMLVFSMNVFTAPQSEDGLIVQKLKQFGVNQKSIDLYKEAKMLPFSSSKFEETALKAIKADPKNYYALDDLGIYYRQVKNNPEKAIEYYKKSIAVNPRNPFPYNSMGIAYTYMNDFANAEKTFKKIFQKNRESLYILVLFGMVLENFVSAKSSTAILRNSITH